MTGASGQTKHTNEERTVKCPVEECDAEPLARGVHLHVMRSSGDGHGPQGEIPTDVSLDDLETVGSREVSMDYPNHRETESVNRLCPYCKRPYAGKHGVWVHLGQVKGRKNHPEEYPDDLDSDDFPIARVDEDDNVLEILDEGTLLPSAVERRSDSKMPQAESDERIREYIEDLREEGRNDEADRAEEMLLN